MNQPCPGRAETVFGNLAYKSLELHEDLELPIVSVLMSINMITTRMTHRDHPHGSIGMCKLAARAIWIVFSA